MTASRPNETDAPQVVKHPGCPQWGLGFLVEERDDKRFYDFEDGLNHSIAKAFWSKLVPVELASDQMKELVAKLRSRKDKTPAAKKPKPKLKAMSFDEQVQYFERAFPGGFSGDAFKREERGEVGDVPERAETKPDKKLKAYKENAIAAAQSLLKREVLSELISAKNFTEGFKRIRAAHSFANVLLHPLGDTIPFGKVPEDKYEGIVTGVFDLLYGADEYRERFDRLANVFSENKVNTWPLSTVLSALCSPKEHVFVKPSLFEKEASVVGFHLDYTRVPSGEAYLRMQGLARDVERRLRERGHEPRDLMDIYSFLYCVNTPPKPVKSPAKAAAAPAPQAG